MFETDTKVCQGCLSSNRRLNSVATGDLMLYYTLLAEDRKLDALSTSDIDLCWECKAKLRRAQKFRAQVQRAHTILEESLGLFPSKATLSSLTIQHKLEYDAIFEETKPNDQPLFSKRQVPDITVDKIVIPTKYKALATEKDDQNEKNIKDVNSSELTKFNHKNDFAIEITSDESDNNENYYASDSDSSLPELTIKRIPPQNRLQDVKIDEQSNINDEKSKNNVAESQCKPIRVNRLVEKVTNCVPIVKTPVLAKLELELQKFMQNLKNNVKTVTAQQNTPKQKKKKESYSKTKNAGGSNDMAELKNDIDRDDKDASEASAENDASKHDRKGSKRTKEESDPDFSVEANEDSDLSHNETEKDEGDGPKENLVAGKGRIFKPKRYKKTILRYKYITDVLSCFTEVEMSMDDLISTLEREDAIIDEKKPITCSICGHRFRLHRMLCHHAFGWHKATHREQFRKGSFYNPPPIIPEEPRLWRCNVCSKLLRRAHVLAHMNENHRTQYYCNGDGCEWTTKGFWLKEDHEEHWKAIHKQFTCDTCGARRRNKPTLGNHMLRAHLNVPKQQCPHCEYSTVSSKYLQKHIQRRHSEPEPAERRYCVECDVTFPSVVKLQRHFYAKHNAARKTYPGGECGRVFASRSSHRSHHDLFHTGKTEHCCHECGKFFSKAQALRNHMKSSHLKIKLPKDKPCTICGRMFQTNRILRHHMCTHTGERPYKCSHCDAAYAQPYCLRTHLAKQHGGTQGARGPSCASPTVTTEDGHTER